MIKKYAQIQERNRVYYLRAFEHLRTSGKNTWNWAAFFLGPIWMFYRKMYLYGLLMSIGFYYRTNNISAVKSAFIFKMVILATFVGLIGHILCGIFGNKLYYRIIKKRIAKGYHMLSDFQPTSIPCGASYGYAGLVYYLRDTLSARKHLRSVKKQISSGNQAALKLTDLEPSNESVAVYLSQSREKSTAQKIIDVVICAIVVGILIINYCASPISLDNHQSDKREIKSQHYLVVRLAPNCLNLHRSVSFGTRISFKRIK